jgi:hypothetical protein
VYVIDNITRYVSLTKITRVRNPALWEKLAYTILVHIPSGKIPFEKPRNT